MGGIEFAKTIEASCAQCVPYRSLDRPAVDVTISMATETSTLYQAFGGGQNMQHRLLFATAIVALMLASCATTVGFDISGEYAVTGTITESTNGGYSVGDTFDEVFVVSESGGTVTIHIGLETWKARDQAIPSRSPTQIRITSRRSR